MIIIYINMFYILIVIPIRNMPHIEGNFATIVFIQIKENLNFIKIF